MKWRANKGWSSLDKGENERSQHKRKWGKLTKEKGKKKSDRERREKQKGKVHKEKPKFYSWLDIWIQ